MQRDLSPEELSYLATTFAVAMTKGLEEHEVRVLCSFFVDVVGTLNLISTQRACLEKYHNGFRRPPDKEYRKPNEK